MLWAASMGELGAGQHAGPVSDIAIDGNRVVSVSQAGCFSGAGPGLQRIHQPDFRWTSAAFVGDRIFLGGGEPGEAGWVGLLDSSTGIIEMLRLADDLINKVAVHPSRTSGAVACAADVCAPAPSCDDPEPTLPPASDTPAPQPDAERDSPPGAGGAGLEDASLLDLMLSLQESQQRILSILERQFPAPAADASAPDDDDVTALPPAPTRANLPASRSSRSTLPRA